MTAEHIDFGARLRAMRAAHDPALSGVLKLAVMHGWTHAALAAELGVSRQAVDYRVRKARPAHGVSVPMPPSTPARTPARRLPRTPYRRTTCHRGHPLVGDNLYLEPDGKRVCRECNRRRRREYLRRRAVRNGGGAS